MQQEPGWFEDSIRFQLTCLDIVDLMSSPWPVIPPLRLELDSGGAIRIHFGLWHFYLQIRLINFILHNWTFWSTMSKLVPHKACIAWVCLKLVCLLLRLGKFSNQKRKKILLYKSYCRSPRVLQKAQLMCIAIMRAFNCCLPAVCKHVDWLTASSAQKADLHCKAWPQACKQY